MIHHGQCSCRALIGAAPRLLYPEFMPCLRRLTAHVDEVSPSCNVSSTMLDAVILFIVHDIEAQAVLERKHNGALFKVSIPPMKILVNIRVN
jgi:hypothetical protein